MPTLAEFIDSYIFHGRYKWPRGVALELFYTGATCKMSRPVLSLGELCEYWTNDSLKRLIRRLPEGR